MNKLRYFDGIRYGEYRDLEVLVDPSDNSLWIANRSIEIVLDYRYDSSREKLASKSLKSFTGKALAVGKNIKGTDSLGRPKEIKAIPFDTFLTLVHFEAFHGKPPSKDRAQALIMAGFADSFSSLVLEQCGIKLTQEKRQQTVSFYLQGYHEFQDWVRDSYKAIHGETPKPEYYREIAIAINQYLFERNHFNCDRIAYAKDAELRRIENFQMQFMETKMPKRGLDPLVAVRKYIDILEDC